MTVTDPRVRSGRFVAKILILGGVLFAAIIGSLLLVLGHWGGEDAPYSETDDAWSVEDSGRRPARRRVVRGAEPGWPSNPQDPAEVAPGTPPAPIRGQVESVGGTPLAGASVCVGGSWGAADDEGSFQVDTPDGPAPWAVLVLAPGYRMEKPVLVAARRIGTPLQLRLVEDRAVVVRGIVSGDEGRPVSGATVRVRVYRAPGTVDAFAALARSHASADEVRAGFEPETTTLTDGTFELRVHAQARHFLVVAEADGHVSESSEPVHVVPGTDVYDASLRLRPERTLRGHVVDAVTGLPVPGATVTTWLSAHGALGDDAVQTNAAGDYVIPDAPRSNVYVLADGYLRSDASYVPGVAELEIRLYKAFRISGRVQRTDGSPVRGAHLRVYARDTRPEGVAAPRATETGEDGRFVFDTIWDSTWTIHASMTWDAKVNFVPADLDGVVAGSTDVVITVRRGRSIAGRVIGPDGEGVSGAYVQCERDGEDLEPGDGAGGRSDDDGAFELRGLSDGTFRVWTGAASAWRGRLYLAAELLGVASGSGAVELRVEAGLSIRGRVVDADGAPVTWRRVFAISPDHVGLAYSAGRTGTTDEDGRFEISGVEQGPYRLQMQPVAPEWLRCYIEGAESVEPGSEELELTLSTGGEITGIVLDETGSLLPDAEVQAVPMEHPSRIESRTRTDSKGRFVLRGLIRSRRYRLYGGEATVEDIAPGARDVRIE